ncbi:MAG: ParB/RepB/Spo0J family partition protein [Sulfitobacter sp.]|uniref:ParB/RepB/Spo0J family partition protein n=1 Tax=unclassified Sulfitobacter TaxID=196795 RepID=UPI0029431D1B|nr:ParB/RepB/Spo0J family partition protein [Sulfitobacter sp. LC.270.F.C4]WOI14525.1 ParB/RepB/Spo0J family partition protein [Sulfitobacter sp. LC.270.F.C4]
MTKEKMGLPRPTKRRVKLTELTTDEITFQPRPGGTGERQLATLCDVLKRGQELDPMAVWENPETGELVIADGHHRLEAHQRTHPDARVRVEVYRCDLKTAMALSMLDNTKERVSLPREDRAQWTWARLLEGGWRVVDLYKLAGISKRTVLYQKSLLKKLEDEQKPIPDTWKKALMGNREVRDFDAELSHEALLAAVDKADQAFGSSLAELCQRRPEAAAELIKRCAGRQNLDYIARHLEWRKMTKAEREAEQAAMPF